MIGQLVESAGAWLGAACPHIPHDPTHALTTSIQAAWYLHPEQHVGEFLALNVFLIALGHTLGKHPWKVQIAADHVPNWSPSLIDRATAVVCLLLAVAITTYKYLTERMIYLLQPCHLLLYCLVFLALKRGVALPTSGTTRAVTTAVDFPSLVFNFYLHNMYGAWLAIVTPGKRGECPCSAACCPVAPPGLPSACVSVSAV